MKNAKKLVCGIGINDSDCHVQPTINGKQQYCKFYTAWVHMLKRCYCAKSQARNPSYSGCTVDSRWHKFSAFKAWMMAEDWQGKQLDKDILVPGNKVYSPDTCCFVDAKTNKFLTDSAAARGEYPIGVSFHQRDQKFKSECSNPLSKKREFLGYFTCPDKAHQAWRKRKHELACQLADLQMNQKVATALRNRFLPELLGDNF